MQMDEIIPERMTLIDIDGSGPLAPFFILCRFGAKAEILNVTEIGHYNELEGYVPSGYQIPNAIYSQTINYRVPLLQVFALVDRSHVCRQYIEYTCFNSRLLNYPNAAFGWWVGRTNQTMDYWGGSDIGTGKCACGLDMTCANPNLFCNCDSQFTTELKDAGFLTRKEFLPVLRVEFGDTGKGADYRIELSFEHRSVSSRSGWFASVRTISSGSSSLRRWSSLRQCHHFPKSRRNHHRPTISSENSRRHPISIQNWLRFSDLRICDHRAKRRLRRGRSDWGNWEFGFDASSIDDSLLRRFVSKHRVKSPFATALVEERISSLFVLRTISTITIGILCKSRSIGKKHVWLSMACRQRIPKIKQRFDTFIYPRI